MTGILYCDICGNECDVRWLVNGLDAQWGGAKLCDGCLLEDAEFEQIEQEKRSE